MLSRMEDIMKLLKKDRDTSEAQVKALHGDMTSAIRKIKVRNIRFLIPVNSYCRLLRGQPCANRFLKKLYLNVADKPQDK